MSEDGVPDLKFSFFHPEVIIPCHPLLLGFNSDSRDLPPLLDRISLRGQEGSVSFLVKIFISKRGNSNFRGDHRFGAVSHGERSFSGGCSGCGAITPKDQRQLRGPSSLERVEASFQGNFNDLVDGLDLAITLPMVRCREVLVDAELITEVPDSLIIELESIV